MSLICFLIKLDQIGPFFNFFATKKLIVRFSFYENDTISVFLVNTFLVQKLFKRHLGSSNEPKRDFFND